jgi:hypothetical protein
MGGYLSTIIGLGVVSLGLGKLNSAQPKAKDTGRPRRWTHRDLTT